MTAYLSCPQWDGNPPDPKSPDEQIRDHTAFLEQYRAGRRMWEPGMAPINAAANWKPQHCEFYKLDAEGNQILDREGQPTKVRTTNDWRVVQDREIIAARHICTQHHVHPEVWARHAAWHRRHQGPLDEKWATRPHVLTVQGQEFTRYIWYRRRPDPNTLHSQWPAYRRPRNAART